MHRPLFWSLFLLFFAQRLAGQSHAVLIPPTTEGDKAVVALPPVRVIDARPDRSALGDLPPALFRHTEAQASRLDTALDAALQAWLAATFAVQPQASPDTDRVMIVRDFYIQGEPRRQAVYAVHLQADFLTGTGDRYRKTASVDSFWEFLIGPPKLVNLQHHVSQILRNQFRSPHLFRADGEAVAAPLATWVASPPPKSFQAYRNEQPAAGIYATAAHFLSGVPGDTAIQYVRSRHIDFPQPIHLFYTRESDGSRGHPIKPGSCFAVSNGQDWFVASDKSWVVLERQNGDFYARQWMRGLVPGVSPQAVGFGVMFGVVGYLAAATLLDDGKTGASQKVPYKARFDPESATFRPYRRIMNY